MKKRVGLSNGYLNNFKGSFGDEKLNNILKEFPKLSNIWLLTGEGEMLKPVSINQEGNKNTAVYGSGNQIKTTDISEMIEPQKGYQEIIKNSQLQISESQAQISRLITIIENKEL